MLFLATLLAFGVSAMVTSSLVHEVQRWRWAATITLALAGLLGIWTGDLVQKALRPFSAALPATAATALGLLPFALVVLRLWLRRSQTPRHVPGIDDDPVLRRYVEEKVRRSRRRRQEAEALENSGDANAP